MDEYNTKYKKMLYKCLMANTIAAWQRAAHTPTNYHLLAAQQEPYQEA